MASSAPAPSYALPSNPHPATHRLPSIASTLSASRRQSELQIPPWKAPADGGPPRRLSTGGFPSVFALPGGEPVEGLGIRGAETEDGATRQPAPAPAPTTLRASKKRQSDPKGSGTKDDSTTANDRSGSKSPESISPRDTRDSPTTSKRPRTDGPSLDSLASAASTILSQSTSPSSSAALAPPSLPPRAASYSHAPSPIGLTFADPKQAETVQASLGVREQQMREIERRRAGTGQPASSGGVAGLNNALGKLRAGKAKDKAPEKEAEGGLGARRGGDAREKTRNMTVVTGYGGEAAQGALRSAPAKVASVSSGPPSSAARPPQTAHPTYREQQQPQQSPREASAPTYRRTSASAASGPTWAPGYSPAPNGRSSVHVPTPLHASHTQQQQRYPSHQLPNPSQQDRSPPTHQYAGPAQYYYPPPSGSGGPLSPGQRYAGDPRNPPPSARLEPPPSRDGPFSPSPSSASSSKSQFLSLFSNFYDSLADSRILARTLESQIAKSSSLLGSLQDSGRMFEELVDARVVRVLRDQQRENETMMRRVARLESLVGGRAAPRRGSQESEPDAQETVWERLERLEKALEGRSDLGEKGVQTVAVSTSAGKEG